MREGLSSAEPVLVAVPGRRLNLVRGVLGEVAVVIRDGFVTSVPGVFAVGDVRAGSVKRVASAVGEGSVVISAVHSYLAGTKAS